ncbi:MAG: DUF296 domain-containing protein [Cyanobacteria bacterium REEB67]|nr:DUF296 domain-containing protein [Cyanobacteria bacterium REEB67]
MTSHALRLMPGQDPYLVLQQLAAQKNIEAAVLLSAVGSLSKAALRFANRDRETLIEGPLEIVSATGVVSRHGMHLHLAAADGDGATRGGHLSPGSAVYTTCEIVLLDLSGEYVFERKPCLESGFDELSVTARRIG